jgi:hypothetical protein
MRQPAALTAVLASLWPLLAGLGCVRCLWPGIAQSCLHAFLNQRPLKFSHCIDDLEHQSAGCATAAPRYRVVAKCTGLTEGQSSVSAAQTVGVSVPINRMVGDSLLPESLSGHWKSFT